LKQTARALFGISEDLYGELSKRIPHAFEWKYLDEEEKVERGGKGKNKKGKKQ
jgi:uncharacterized protein (DUF2249 family)